MSPLFSVASTRGRRRLSATCARSWQGQSLREEGHVALYPDGVDSIDIEAGRDLARLATGAAAPRPVPADPPRQSRKVPAPDGVSRPATGGISPSRKLTMPSPTGPRQRTAGRMHRVLPLSPAVLSGWNDLQTALGRAPDTTTRHGIAHPPRSQQRRVLGRGDAIAASRATRRRWLVRCGRPRRAGVRRRPSPDRAMAMTTSARA
jgi:hypothetical protein